MADTGQTTQLSEIAYLSSKIEESQLPQGLFEQIDLKIKRLRRMARQGQSAGEYESVAKYIDWCMSIPWGTYSPENLDINQVKQSIDQLHYGSEDVKQVILEYIAVLNRKSQLQDQTYSAPVLAFVGVQGAGKTSLAKAIAKSLGRPFVRLPLGAVGSSTELRGESSTHLGAKPGMIIKSIVDAGSLNPVILLDEFDKVSGNESSRQDFMAIMLEILDPGQNHSFSDRYVDYPIDLSKVMFIATANRFNTISRELLDRMEFIEFEDYTVNEKQVIAKNYLYPKALEYAGLQPNELVIQDDAWPKLVEIYGNDQGVRRLEQNLKKLSRLVLKGIVSGQFPQVVINKENAHYFEKYALPSVEEVRDKDFTLKRD